MKRAFIILFMINQCICLSQNTPINYVNNPPINNLDTICGWFLLESYWDDIEYTNRSSILPIDVTSIFGGKSNLEIYELTRLYAIADFINKDANFKLVDMSERLLLGNSSLIDFKKPKEVVLDELKYYVYYLRFVYNKGEYEKRRFPKLNSKNRVKRMSLRKVQVNQIINVLEIEW